MQIVKKVTKKTGIPSRLARGLLFYNAAVAFVVVVCMVFQFIVTAAASIRLARRTLKLQLKFVWGNTVRLLLSFKLFRLSFAYAPQVYLAVFAFIAHFVAFILLCCWPHRVRRSRNSGANAQSAEDLEQPTGSPDAEADVVPPTKEEQDLKEKEVLKEKEDLQ